MPKMRRKTSELFKIVLEVHKEIKVNGICWAIQIAQYDGLITDIEERRLENILEKRQPTKRKHPNFFKHRQYIKGSGYLWPRIFPRELQENPNLKVTHRTTQRVKFIKELIKFYKAKKRLTCLQ